MSTKNQREQLMHTAIGQFTLIVGVVIGSWLYTMPLYSELSTSVTETNQVIVDYKNLANNGIEYKLIEGLLRSSKWKEELIGIIQSAPLETQAVTKKVWWDPYLTWLINEIGKSQEDKEKLAIKKWRLNSILPTLNPISNNINEDTVSLKKYITFVEENIIKKFNLDSTAALSIQNIKYGTKGGAMPETVGSFDNDISFKTTNGNIAKLIEYVNNLGRPDILVDTGSTIIGWEPTIMSNPLAMINSFSLESPLDLTKPNDENTGRMTIRFYVRGSSMNDVAFLTSTIATRKTALSKKIELALSKCNSEITCPRQKELQLLSKKYAEFVKGNTIKKQAQGIALIYALSSELNSVASLEEELRKLTGK